MENDYYHTDKEGNEILLKDLELGHLKNIIKWIENLAEKGFNKIIDTRSYDIFDPDEEPFYIEDSYIGNEALEELNHTLYTDELNRRMDEKVHELKIWPEYFIAQSIGVKTFEIRLNDRDFKVGHIIILREFDHNGCYTGRKLSKQITYMLENHGGLRKGYCILGTGETE